MNRGVAEMSIELPQWVGRAIARGLARVEYVGSLLRGGKITGMVTAQTKGEVMRLIKGGLIRPPHEISTLKGYEQLYQQIQNLYGGDNE